MDTKSREALAKLNAYRSEWIARLDLTDADLDKVGDDGWTIRKWLYRMADHETIHLGQIAMIRRSLEPVWRAAVRFRQIDRLIGELHELRGRLAAQLAGMPDELFDARAPEVARSVREVLEHIGEAERTYVGRIERLR